MKESYKLFYDCIFEFKNQYYGKLLRHEHLAQKSQISIYKFRLPGVEDPVEMDFWGYWLIKDGINYLIESTDENREEIDIQKLLPVEARDIQKVSDTKGKVYHLVRSPVPKRIRGEPVLTIRELIDNLTLLEHSSPRQQKLLAMMAMSQLWDRSYYRVATPPGCVDSNTEFLTPAGWKRISEYAEGDKVLQFDIETDEASFVTPIEYIKQRSEGFYHLKTKFLDQKLSKDHGVLYEREGKNRHIQRAEELFERHNRTKSGSGGKKILTTFNLKDEKSKIELTDEEIRLMVAAIADGCFVASTKERPNLCSAQFKKESKVKRFEKLLKETHLEYSKVKYKDGYTRFKFNAPLKSKSYASFWGCSASQLAVINNEVLFWDGNGKNLFYTTDKEGADFIQFCFTSCGFRSSITVASRLGQKRQARNKKEYTRKSIDYVVSRTKHTKVGFTNSQGNHRVGFVPSEDGLEYCFTVPAGFLVLRREGKIFITKNCGKDSIVEVCSYLFGECGTIESPTAAKLEDRATVLKWLVVNEVVDIAKADWDIIQQFLLSAGAHKNEITKRSRAFQNVGEIIDTSTFSLSLFFNDLLDYEDPKKYFDYVTKKAVLDRFPAFRFFGKYTEDFNAMKNESIPAFVKDNWDFYVDTIKSYTYYKKHYKKFIHNYSRSKLMSMDGRTKINLGRLLNVVDAYCNTQEEFDSWIETINNSMLDYVDMVMFINVLYSFVKERGEEELLSLKEDLKKYNTYAEKKRRLEEIAHGVKAKNPMDVDISSFDGDIL